MESSPIEETPSTKHAIDGDRGEHRQEKNRPPLGPNNWQQIQLPDVGDIRRGWPISGMGVIVSFLRRNAQPFHP